MPSGGVSTMTLWAINLEEPTVENVKQIFGISPNDSYSVLSPAIGKLAIIDAS